MMYNASFNDLSLDDRVAMLNGDQRRIFDNVTSNVMRLMNAHVT